MTLVATFISPEHCPALAESLIRDLKAILHPRSAAVTLKPEVAADIVFPAPVGAIAELRSALGEVLAGLPVDVVVQPASRRRKKLLVADMDSTMIGQECIDELAGECGIKDEVAAITEQAMRGELEFEAALRERVALLAGLAEAAVQHVIDNRVTLTPGAVTLVRTMRAGGAYCSLVSGGFTAFTSVIAARIGFDENRANVLDAANGVFNGKVREPILGRQAKRDRLLALRAELALAPDETLAVGDGANDIALIEAAGLGVAYHGKSALVEKADATIEYCGLTALLYAQGFRYEQFVPE